MIDIEESKRNEKDENNRKDYINDFNNDKLSLRKSKNFYEIKKRREYKMFHITENNNINKEYQFQIFNFDSSFNIIENYLKSNNPDLISYCLREIGIYFNFNCPNIKEQKKIKETKFLNTLLYFGNKFIQENKIEDLLNIFSILINILIYEEGTFEFIQEIYSDTFFDFFNLCLDYANKLNNEENQTLIYRKIMMILKTMSYYNDINYFPDLNLIFLRSQVFLKIFEFYSEKNMVDVGDIKELLELITYIVNLTNLEQSMCKNDINIIDKCLKFLIIQLCSGDNKVDFLTLIFESISHISGLSMLYDFNSKLINEGVTTKILKMKFDNKNKVTKNYLKMLKFAMRILANNLTMSDDECKIFYSLNIIDYYNNILDKFDDNKAIVHNILYGLYNISLSSYYEVLKSCNIWKEKNIQKYFNYDDDVKILFIRIIKELITKDAQEFIIFFYDTKILEYLMHIFACFNIGKKCGFKIIEIIDLYLSLFKKESKETKEYLFIFDKFKDLFRISEKINDLIDKEGIIPIIEKRILSNYE